jgi:hypothetical protein
MIVLILAATGRPGPEICDLSASFERDLDVVYQAHSQDLRPPP